MLEVVIVRVQMQLGILWTDCGNMLLLIVGGKEGGVFSE